MNFDTIKEYVDAPDVLERLNGCICKMQTLGRLGLPRLYDAPVGEAYPDMDKVFVHVKVRVDNRMLREERERKSRKVEPVVVTESPLPDCDDETPVLNEVKSVSVVSPTPVYPLVPVDVGRVEATYFDIVGLFVSHVASPSISYDKWFEMFFNKITIGLDEGCSTGIVFVDDWLRRNGKYGDLVVGFSGCDINVGSALVDGNYITGHAGNWIHAVRSVRWRVVVSCDELFPIRTSKVVEPKSWGMYKFYRLLEGTQDVWSSLSVASGFAGLEKVDRDGDDVLTIWRGVGRPPEACHLYSTALMCELDTDEFYDRCQLMGRLTGFELLAVGTKRGGLVVHPEREFKPVLNRWYYVRDLRPIPGVNLRARIETKIVNNVCMMRFVTHGSFSFSCVSRDTELTTTCRFGCVGTHRNAVVYQFLKPMYFDVDQYAQWNVGEIKDSYTINPWCGDLAQKTLLLRREILELVDDELTDNEIFCRLLRDGRFLHRAYVDQVLVDLSVEGRLERRGDDPIYYKKISNG